MPGAVVEVRVAQVSTFDGETMDVQGGAYLSPEAWLSHDLELRRLREEKAQSDAKSMLVPGLMFGAALLGAAFGYWYARDNEE
jgi:hypothetical protein